MVWIKVSWYIRDHFIVEFFSISINRVVFIYWHTHCEREMESRDIFFYTLTTSQLQLLFLQTRQERRLCYKTWQERWLCYKCEKSDENVVRDASICMTSHVRCYWEIWKKKILYFLAVWPILSIMSQIERRNFYNIY